MSIYKGAILSGVALTVLLSCHAQHKFPLRPGEWAYTSSSRPGETKMICLNDQLWNKALTRNPACRMRQTKLTSSGATYSMECPGFEPIHMTGKLTLTFDGREHMIGKGTMYVTMSGHTTSSDDSGEYRWKSDQCSENDDAAPPPKSK